jgi:hypothetical protein
VERVVSRRTVASFAWIVMVWLTPAPSAAQAPAGPASRTWIIAGGGSTTLLGDCTDCAADTYIHSGSLIAGAGVSLNSRTDVGAEVLWVPTTLTTGDHVRATFLMASVQFRPWQSKGFFLRAGSGMAFLRNWVNTFEETSPPVRSKAFALGLGAGWEWRMRGRMGLQVFGAQHVAALGDLETSAGTTENVMGNFWSVGGAVVIR